MKVLIDSLIGTLMILAMGGYVGLGGWILMLIDDRAKYKKTLTGLTIFLWLWGVMMVVAYGSK